MQWACGAGILSGTGNRYLHPETELPREQLAVILYRYSQLPEKELPAESAALEDVGVVEEPTV